MPSCRVLGWINFHLKSLTISARILTSKYQLFEAGVSSDGSSNYRTVFSNLSYNEVSSAVKWKVLGFVIQAWWPRDIVPTPSSGGTCAKSSDGPAVVSRYCGRRHPDDDYCPKDGWHIWWSFGEWRIKSEEFLVQIKMSIQEEFWTGTVNYVIGRNRHSVRMKIRDIDDEPKWWSKFCPCYRDHPHI